MELINKETIDFNKLDNLIGLKWSEIKEVIRGKFSHRWDIETAAETYDQEFQQRVLIRIETDGRLYRICELRFHKNTHRLEVYSICTGIKCEFRD